MLMGGRFYFYWGEERIISESCSWFNQFISQIIGGITLSGIAGYKPLTPMESSLWLNI